jgi:hypothetical protein
MWVIGFFIQFFGQFPYRGAANISQMPHGWAKIRVLKAILLLCAHQFKCSHPREKNISQIPKGGETKIDAPHMPDLPPSPEA